MLETQEKLLISFNKKPENIASWDMVPITNKADLRDSKVPTKFHELRITSGSTGNPLYVFYSKEAVDAFIRRAIISLKKSDVTSKDTVLNLFAYGNYVPGSMYEKACQNMNISVMPLGAPNTYSKDKVIDAILKIKPNVWLSVPSYAISLLDLLAKEKKPGAFPKKIIVAGERLLDSYIKKFKDYNIEVINHFGLTECPAIGVSSKHNPKIIKVINDGIYVECLKENGLNYLVITDLNNTATPIIRYKTGDIIDNIKSNKDSTLSEVSIVGRSDDLVKIQGELISKTKIVETLSHFTDKFLVNIRTKKTRDFVEVTLDQACKKNEVKIDNELAFLKKRKLIFKTYFSIPKTSSYKSTYIVDSRR
jgi:phenylacetate-CoA ligase